MDIDERGTSSQTGGLWAVAAEAWENKTGEDMPPRPEDWPDDTDLIGQLLQTDEEKYAAYPKLAEKFRPQCEESLEESDA